MLFEVTCFEEAYNIDGFTYAVKSLSFVGYRVHEIFEVF